MARIACNNCRVEKDISEFLKNPLNTQAKPLKNCSTCRARFRASNSKKRAAKDSLPVQPAKRRRTPIPSGAPLQPIAQLQSDDRSTTRMQPGNQPASTPINPPTLLDPNTRPTSSATRSHSPASTLGFLPQSQWNWIQGFHMALTKIKMEYCTRCKERWFEMRLRGEVCHNCFNRDEKRKDYRKDYLNAIFGACEV
jgi:hypothetical protein